MFSNCTIIIGRVRPPFWLKLQDYYPPTFSLDSCSVSLLSAAANPCEARNMAYLQATSVWKKKNNSLFLDLILSPGLLHNCKGVKEGVGLHCWRWQWSMQPSVLAACDPQLEFWNQALSFHLSSNEKSSCRALREHKPKPCKRRKFKTQAEGELSPQEKTTDMWWHKTPRNESNLGRSKFSHFQQGSWHFPIWLMATWTTDTHRVPLPRAASVLLLSLVACYPSLPAVCINW